MARLPFSLKEFLKDGAVAVQWREKTLWPWKPVNDLTNIQPPT